MQHSWASYSGTVHNVLLDGSRIDLLDAVKVPVRFVIGLRDPIPNRPLLGQVAAERPGTSLAEWADADHELVLTHPRPCIDELRRALAVD